MKMGIKPIIGIALLVFVIGAGAWLQLCKKKKQK